MPPSESSKDARRPDDTVVKVAGLSNLGKPASEQPPLRNAATVMLVRDGADGIEVFMLRRNLNSDFVGGAYVFPGGAVDPHDSSAEHENLSTGRSDAEASAALGLPSGGLAYWVAAVRECFEEAGVLLAHGPDGAVVSFADPAVAARFDAHRTELNAGNRKLLDILRDEGLAMPGDRIHYWSHWITPVGPPRRFDTRFFVCAAPPEQVALHDDAETIDNMWIRPADALEKGRRGEIEIIFPTVKNLESIARFGTSAELLAAASQVGSIPTILPRIVQRDGRVDVLIPGDPGYDEA